MSTYADDANGRLVRDTNGHSEVRFERDALVRVVAETCDQRTVRSAYDSLGRKVGRQERVAPDGQNVLERTLFAWDGPQLAEQQAPGGEAVSADGGSLWGMNAGSPCPLRFPGQYHDEESGVHYNYHRYDDPGTARYLTADPHGLAGGANPHAYVPNPLDWIDPAGPHAQVTGRQCSVSGHRSSSRPTLKALHWPAET